MDTEEREYGAWDGQLPAGMAEEERAEKNRVESGTLYLVATPIGNLDDISVRAAKILRECDFIAAEDTRVTAKLLHFLDLRTPVIPYYEHNKREAGTRILKRLQDGESCALVTDAGTPGISDPGYDLVQLCIAAAVPVTAVPGACAAIDALILSGMDTRRFCFEGFLEGNTNARRSRLEALANDTRTLILYETPHDLRATLALLSEVFGPRRIALCREMTKRNEEILRMTLPEALEFYRTREPRGEYVLLLEGRREDAGRDWSGVEISDHVQFYIDSGMDRMDAMKMAAKDRGVPKKVIYQAWLERE